MATIISFKAASRGSHQALTSANASLMAGEIILFPGVRYEYDAAAQRKVEQKPKRKSARKRDKLVLQD